MVILSASHGLALVVHEHRTMHHPDVPGVRGFTHLEDGLLDNLRVDGCHTVGGLATNGCHESHVDQPAFTARISQIPLVSLPAAVLPGKIEESC